MIADLSNESNASGRRRLLLGIALAIALEEIIAAVVPAHLTPPAQTERVVTTSVQIVRTTPTPKPTPLPVVHARKVAQTQRQATTVSPAAPSKPQHIRRVASAPSVAHVHPHPHLVPIKTGGHGASTSVAKALTGGVGNGQTGSGVSGSGAGTGGAAAAHEPCGEVDFQPTSNPIVDPATGRIWEHMEMMVHFPDGSVQSVPLDYPWYYPSREQDPFMPGNASVPATFQPPPPDQRANQPPLVAYVIAHSTPDGYTLLRDCPGAAP